MKKALLLILALTMVFAMVACGNNAKSESNSNANAGYPVDEPFMKLTIPEGWEYDAERSTLSQVYITKSGGGSPEQSFQFNKSSGDAQTAYDEELAFWGEDRTPMEDKMYGFYSYKRLGFTWNSLPSICLFTDWDNHPGESIAINCFCIDPGDPIIQEVIQSVNYF